MFLIFTVKLYIQHVTSKFKELQSFATIFVLFYKVKKRKNKGRKDNEYKRQHLEKMHEGNKEKERQKLSDHQREFKGQT